MAEFKQYAAEPMAEVPEMKELIDKKMKEMAELKPCYHCGTTKFLEVAEMVIFSMEAYQVKCPMCGVRGPICCKREEAIDAWNKRS